MTRGWALCRLPAYSLPVLAILALAAALLWLQPADFAQAQDDAKGPKITGSPSIISSPENDDTYRAGETITVKLTFSKPVTVTGKPRLRLNIGDLKRWAGYDSTGADGATLSFTHTVKADDADADGISIGRNQLRLNGGTIEDADGNAAELKHPPLRAQAGHKVQGSLDYDSDNDGLISVVTRAQLAAIALDLDGDGAPDSDEDADEYRAAFPAAAGMGCPEDTGCAGYELDGNLNITVEWPRSWSPIGANGAGFTGTFDGNGNTISGLYIHTPNGKETGSNSSALFARLDAGGVIRNVGVVRPDIHSRFGTKRSPNYAGGLVGYNQGAISGSYVNGGTISVYTRSTAGGLVGYNRGTISNSHASASVSITHGDLSKLGGLVGRNEGAIRDSHANASIVTSASQGSSVGGLVGRNGIEGTTGRHGASISNSYASGAIESDGHRLGGLVGWLTEGTISNSRASVNVVSNEDMSWVGGLVGHSQNETLITDSYASGKVRASDGQAAEVGGLVGFNQRAYITNSYASGKVRVTDGHISSVGGLVGETEGGTISNSHASGNVSVIARLGGGANRVGGLVGRTEGGTISNSYARGSVNARVKFKYDYPDKVGGLVGWNDEGGSISNSYASGSVSADGDDAANVGGLVGRNDDGTIGSSYWDKRVAGVATSDGSPKKAGKTTKQMKKATGPTSNIYAGWDTGIWDFSDTTDYPTLR